MPYVRRFYYLPRDNAPKDTDVLAPCESLWKFEGTSLHSNHDECKANSARPKSFQDLPNEEQIKQLRYKKILGMLNKMTPKKFQKLILQIGPESMDVTYVKMLAEIIFSKALVDEMYVNLYAKLCEEVTSTLPTESLDCFKQVLIDLCETGFNQLLDLSNNDIGCIHEDKRYTFKRRLMTLMRFIGEMSCISVPFFDRIYNWHLTEQLIDKGDELHLEAVYFLLFTISLRSTDNAWTKRIERAVGRISYGCEPMGKGEVRSEIKFKFQALSDLRNGCLQQSYCAEWNRATDQDIIFNFHFISGSFPECSNKSSKEIVEILIKSTGFFNIKTWKVTDIVNSDSFAHVIFVIDNQSFVWLNNRNFSVSFQSFNICFRLLDSNIPLKSTSIKKLNESQDSNSSEIDDSSSESDSDDDNDDQGGGDSSDSDSNGTTYGSAVGDKDMLDVLSKFGLTVKNGCVKKAELSESDETDDSSDIDESSTDEDNLYENSTTEVENDANFDNNFLSDRLDKSQAQINPTVITNEVKKNLIKQDMSINTVFIMDEAAINSDVTSKRTEESKQIENLQENSVNVVAKTNKSANEIDKNCKNVLIKPESSKNSRMAFQFDEIIEFKQNVKKNESVPVIATEKLATALTLKINKSAQSIPTEKLVITSSSNDCKIDKSSSFSLSTKIENSANTMISCFPDNQKKSFCLQVKGKKIVLPEIPSHKFAFFGNFKGLFRLKNADLLLILEKHNKNAQIKKWKIVDRASISDNEAQITFTAPRSIISDLKKINYTINFESNDVFLNPVDFTWDKDVEKITKSVADSSDFNHFEISITPMNFPFDLFSDETLKLLEDHITNKKEEFLRNQLSWENGLETELNFDAICVMKGWLLILCSNRETLNWILFLHFSSTYVLKHIGVNIPRINVSGYFPFSINDNQLLEKISKENNWVKDWNIVKREERALGALITFSIDAKSAHHLLKNKHVIKVTKSIQYKVELVWEDLIRVIKSPEMSIGKLSSGGDSLVNSDKILFEGEFFYSCRFDTKSIFNSLVACNKNVDLTTWNVVKRTDLNDSSVRLTFSANRKFLKCLDKINYSLFYNTQVVQLTLLNNQKWKDILNFEYENSSSSVKKVDEQQGFKYKIDERLFKKSEDKYSDYKPTKVNDRVTFQAVFPKSVKYTTKNILSILSQCNKNLNLLSWSSVARNDLNNDVRLTFCADRDEMKCLKQFDFSLFYNIDIIKLSPISDKSWKDELECDVTHSVNVPEQNNKSNNIVFEGVFPKTKMFLKENFLQKLSNANLKLGMEKWKIIDKDCQKQNVYILFSADIDTLQMLKQAKYIAYYGGNKILFHPADFDGWDEAFDKCISDQNVSRAMTPHMNKIPDVSRESSISNVSRGSASSNVSKESSVSNISKVPSNKYASREFTSSNVSKESSISNTVSKVPSIKNVSRESTSSNVSKESSVSNTVSKVPSIKNVSRESSSSNVSSQSTTTEQLNKTGRVKQNSNLPDVVQNAKPLVILFTGEFPKSSHLKNKTIKNTLVKLNPKLQSSEWTIMLRQNKKLVAKITFSADYKLIKPLFEANFKLCYNHTAIYVKPFNNISWDGIVNILDVHQYNECVKSQIESISKDMSAPLAHIGNLKESLIQMSNKKEPQLQSGNPNECLIQSLKENVALVQNVNSQLKDQKESQVASNKRTESQNKAKLALFQVTLPDSCDMKNKELYNCLLNCNKKLGVAKWTLVKCENANKLARLIFKADYNCIRLLKDYQYKISYQKNQLKVKPLNQTWDEWEQILNPSLKIKIDSEYEKSSSSKNCKKASDESYDYGTAYPIHLNYSLPSSSYSTPSNASHNSKTSTIPLNESIPSTSINYRSSSNDPLPSKSRASASKSIANNSLPFTFHDATYKNVANDSAPPPNDVVYDNVANFPAPSVRYSSPYRLMNDSKPPTSNLVITNKTVDSKSFSNLIPNLIGYKVAILPANFPSVLFTEEQFKRIETVLNEYIYYEKVSNKLQFIPKFNAIKKFGGWMLVLCYDNLTADWLVNLELEPWVKAKLTVVRED